MNDFGVRGEHPVHPELLDWLAADYRRLGWSREDDRNDCDVRDLSASVCPSRGASRDRSHQQVVGAPEPVSGGSGDRARSLPLGVRTSLDKFGGPSVFPPLPAGVAALSYSNKFKWNASEGENRIPPRPLYTFFKRTAPHPNLITFDCPDSNTTNVRRRTSNTPLQALTMLNNEVFVEASRAFARRLLEMEAVSDDQRMQQALRLCIGREPARCRDCAIR